MTPSLTEQVIVKVVTDEDTRCNTNYCVGVDKVIDTNIECVNTFHESKDLSFFATAMLSENSIKYKISISSCQTESNASKYISLSR